MELLQARLTSLLATSGFDLIAPFTAQAYNASRKPGVPELPTFGRDQTLAFIVGNTKALWPRFLGHLASHPEDTKLEEPLDAYTQTMIQASVWEACSEDGLGSQIRWGFNKASSEEGFVDLLHAAQVSGLAFLDEDIHLCTHPIYGPWIALRAVVLVDIESAGTVCTPLLSDPFPELRSEIHVKLNDMRATGAMDDWAGRWRDWAGLRTLAGRKAQVHAYDTHQMEYHYTKSRAVLETAVESFKV